jgi:O-antigen/teichoic acid export membrane protein
MAIVSAQALILTPLYLHSIGARLFGAWLATGDILVWLQAFDLGLPNLMIQRIGAAHGRGDMASVGEWFASSLAVLSVTAFCLAMGSVVLARVVPGWMGLAGDDAALLRSCFRLSGVAAAACVLNNGFVGFSRGIQDTALMNAVSLISVVASLVTAFSGITLGLGLWTPALAAAARAVVLLAGSLLFAAPYLRGPLKGHFRIHRVIVRELTSILPATAFGGLGYAAMNQSQIALAAMFLRPEAAVVLSVTRKAADLLRAIADTIGASVFGSFASLAGSNERGRALRVLQQICAVRAAVVISGAAAYLAVNHALVSMWVGPRQFGGTILTMLIAVESTIAGGAYLFNYLYRATGPVSQGSLILLLESLVRVPLMILGLKWFGLAGPPMAASITAAASFLLVRNWTLRRLSGWPSESIAIPTAVWLGRLLLCGVGLCLCLIRPAQSWSYVAVAGLGVSLSGLAILTMTDPRLSEPRRFVFSLLRRRQLLPV